MIVADLRFESTALIRTRPTSGQTPKVHLFEDCYHVQKADGYVFKPARVGFDDWDICQNCEGRLNPNCASDFRASQTV